MTNNKNKKKTLKTKNEEISKTKSLRLQTQERSPTVSESEIMYEDNRADTNSGGCRATS